MKIEEIKRLEIIKLVASLPIDNKVRTSWVNQLQQEDVPKALLFDIMATLEASTDVESADLLEKIRTQIENHLGETYREIQENEAVIDESIADIETSLKKIEEKTNAYIATRNRANNTIATSTPPGEQEQNTPANSIPASQAFHTRTSYPQNPPQQNQSAPPVNNEYY